MFRSWPALLPAFVQVVPIELDARYYDPPSITPPTARVANVASIITELVDGADLNRVLDLPFAVFGHSLGALLAFELCRALAQRHKRTPGQLVVSARRPLDATDPIGHAPLHALDDDGFVQAVAHIYDGVPAALRDDVELLHRSLPSLRADVALLELHQHRAGPPLACPITAYCGSGDHTALAHMDGWRRQTTAAFVLRTFPGGHFYIEDDRAAVLSALGRDLRAL